MTRFKQFGVILAAAILGLATIMFFSMAGSCPGGTTTSTGPWSTTSSSSSTGTGSSTLKAPSPIVAEVQINENGLYVVASDEGELITVGHQYQKRRQPRKGGER